jgi:hypothetical protein
MMPRRRSDPYPASIPHCLSPAPSSRIAIAADTLGRTAGLIRLSRGRTRPTGPKRCVQGSNSVTNFEAESVIPSPSIIGLERGTGREDDRDSSLYLNESFARTSSPRAQSEQIKKAKRLRVLEGQDYYDHIPLRHALPLPFLNNYLSTCILRRLWIGSLSPLRGQHMPATEFASCC